MSTAVTPLEPKALDQLAINTIRILSIDAVQHANSGHPGLPLGAAAMAYVLWTRFLKHNPHDPQWPDRDRFVLSAGHGSMLLYSLLYLTGYDLPMEQLKRFRQLGSETPGHPERGDTPGVEVTTGPLGQGFGMGVGLAMAEAWLAATFNKDGSDPVFNHYTYGIVSDGDVMEGVASEAASLAGHLKLGKLIYLYDQNHISLAGGTALTFTEDVAKRFDSYGWHTKTVLNGNDTEEIDAAIREAQAETDRPSLLLVHTHIGFGSPKQDSFHAHGSPLGEKEVAETKKNLGWPTMDYFYVPQDALDHFRKAVPAGEAAQKKWQGVMDSYSKSNPAEGAKLDKMLAGELPEDWAADLPKWKPTDKPVATRVSAGQALSGLAKRIPNLLGGSADLNPSTNTALKDAGDFEPAGAYGDKCQGGVGGVWSFAGRNLHFGVREHAMGAAVNGLAAHGGVIPYSATFMTFSDYMKPAIRLGALMQLQAIYVFTHDSIGLGEDGPTHQPIEQLAGLRAIPGLTVIRPADANESAEGWAFAVNHNGPTLFVLSRQNLPIQERIEGSTAGVAQGAYILAEAEGGAPDVILIGTGSEVSICMQAREQLKAQGVKARVVSMPSWELFEKQEASYRDTVLPPSVTKRVTVEAASTFGWARWAGTVGACIGIDRFGASGPGDQVMKFFGFTPENIAKTALQLLDRK